MEMATIVCHSHFRCASALTVIPLLLWFELFSQLRKKKLAASGTMPYGLAKVNVLSATPIPRSFFLHWNSESACSLGVLSCFMINLGDFATFCYSSPNSLREPSYVHTYVYVYVWIFYLILLPFRHWSRFSAPRATATTFVEHLINLIWHLSNWQLTCQLVYKQQQIDCLGCARRVFSYGAFLVFCFFRLHSKFVY